MKKPSTSLPVPPSYGAISRKAIKCLIIASAVYAHIQYKSFPTAFHTKAGINIPIACFKFTGNMVSIDNRGYFFRGILLTFLPI